MGGLGSWLLYLLNLASGSPPPANAPPPCPVIPVTVLPAPHAYAVALAGPSMGASVLAAPSMRADVVAGPVGRSVTCGC